MKVGILSYSAAGILDEAKQDTARGHCQFELVAASGSDRQAVPSNST